MRQYEITFIVDPVLSNDEISSTAQNYSELLKSAGCEIVNVDEMGLRALAYPIKKRTSGVYYCVEFTSPGGDVISKLELALQRDERIIRFLTVVLDKYGIKYNQDKRDGLIGKKRDKKETAEVAEAPKKAAPKAEPKPAAVEAAPAPAAVAASEEEE